MKNNFPFSIFHFPLLSALALVLFFATAPLLPGTAASAQNPPEKLPTISGLRQSGDARNAEIEGEARPEGAEGGEEGQAEQSAEEAPKDESAPRPARGDILQEGWWGTGGYISPTKLGLYLLLFFLWTFSASWMNADMERLKNANRESFNLMYFGLYVGLGGILMFVPFFWGVLPATVLICLVPLITYILKRNGTVPPHEMVMTPEHIYFLYATLLNRIGVKIKVKQRQAYEVGPPIDLETVGKGIDPRVLQGRLILARNSPGYNEFRQQIYDALESHATGLMFDFAPERTAIRHQVDGVWLDLVPMPRTVERGKTKDVMEEMLESAKLLVGANPNDRRSRQGGSFIIATGPKRKTKYEADLLTQGTKTGEAAMVQFTAKKVPFQTLDQLGMRPELQTKILAQLNAKKGVFIVAAPPANGLRSSMDVFSRVCDRFTRDVVNVEDIAAPTEEIENVILAQYDSSKGETPMKVLPDVLFKEPHTLIVRNLLDLESLQLCCDEVDKDRLFITTARARDGVEAILRFLATKIPPQQFLSKLNGVVCQRLIRKLCPECKEPYQPSGQLLQQLGLRPEQVKEFYRMRTPLPEPEERKRGICPNCNGVGYRGRTALFELLEVNDTIRETILANPNAALIRQQFVSEGQTGFLYEGIHLLLNGDTTVEEFSRIMKI